MPTDYALQFDSTQKSLLSLGTLGNLGSQLGSGFFIEFDFQSTAPFTGIWGFGIYAGSPSSRVWISFSNSILNYSIGIVVGANTQGGLELAGGMTTQIKLNDGKKRRISIQAFPATNTIEIKIDGVAQTITYSKQQTPALFSNFLGSFYIGARNNNQFNNTFEGYWSGTIDNLRIGTSPSNIYAGWGFNEGTGTTAADYTGNGRTATLTNGSGGAKPAWVTGLKRIYINIGSEVYKVGRDAYIKVSGSWKRVKNMYLKMDGVWKTIY